MITAYASPHDNYLSVVFKYGDKTIQAVRIPGQDQQELIRKATQQMYALNTQYINLKLKAWLRQRMFAFGITDRPKYNQDAAKLIVMLKYYEDWEFHKLCSLVTRYRHAFEALAPAETSGHYAAYKNNIEPILDFCAQMKQ